MKRIFSLLLILCIVLLSFAACDKTDGGTKPGSGTSNQTSDSDKNSGNTNGGSNKTPADGTTPEIPDDGEDDPATPGGDEIDDATLKAKYDAAMALIAEGRLEEAYAALKEISDYADAEKQLGYFYYAPTRISYVDDEENSETVECTYDAHDRLIKAVYTDIWDGEADTETVELTYDAKGRPQSATVTYPSGDVWTYSYEYDEQGHLVKETGTDSDGNTSTRVCVYDVKDNLVKSAYTYPGGEKAVYDYTYDDKGNLVREEYTYSYDGSKNTYITKYTYDDRGNLVKEEYTDPDGYESVYNNTYDDKGNLVKVVYTNSYYEGTYTVNYTYDANGNLLKRVCTDPYGETFTAEECTYDAKGNLIQRVEKYSYDSANCYTMYTYDENGNCIKEEYTGESGYQRTTEWTYDKNGNITKEIYTSGGDVDVTEITYFKLVYMPYELPYVMDEFFDVSEWVG